MDTGLCWTAGYESESSSLDWTEQAAGTRLQTSEITVLLHENSQFQ